MRRRHRTAHARIWMVLAILLPSVIVAAMVIRQQGPTEAPAIKVDVPAATVSDP